MNIPLHVLVEASECLYICRNADVVGRRLTTDEFMRVLRIASEFSWHVEQITKQTTVEVTNENA